MNILFLTLGKVNNIDDKGIYTDLLRKFDNEGHQLFLVSPYEKRIKKPTEVIIKNNVTLLRVKTGNITKVNMIEKGISTLTIESKFLKAIKNKFNNVKFDLILYSTPPITFSRIVSYIKKRDEAKSYLLLKDIFPQNAIDLGMFSNKSILSAFFRRKEKKLYEISDYIGCMSEANVDFVLKNNKFIKKNKIEVCPNSIEIQDIELNEEVKNNIKRKYNIPLNRTVFIYGGNLGKPQGIDFLIRCLERNKNNENVHFIIAGSGTEYDKLDSAIKKMRINNVQLFNQLQKSDYELLAQSCDVGLIFLDYKFTIPNFPSRLLSYMQASMPVLAATDENTDIGKVIEEGKFGFWCPSNDVEKFTEKVNVMCNNTENKKLGENALKYLKTHYSIDKSYEIIMKHFR